MFTRKRITGILAATVLVAAIHAHADSIASASSSENLYSVNMVDIPIVDMAESIGAIKNIAFQIDPRVRGSITIRSDKRLTADQLMRVFLNQLRMNSLTMVEIEEGHARIVPDQSARFEALEVGVGRPQPNDIMTTRVIDLQGLDGAAITSILTPMMDRRSALIAHYPDANILVITDWGSNISQYVSLIDVMRGMNTRSSEIIEISHADPDALSTVISSLVGRDSSLQGVTAIPMNRPKVIILSGPSRARGALKEVILALDRPTDVSGSSEVVFLRHSTASSIREAISSIPFRYDGEQQLVVSQHEDTNALILSGTPTQIESARNLIRQIDIRRAQVHVEAIIVEVSDAAARDLGLQWLIMGGADGTIPLGGVNLPSSNPGIPNVTGALASGKQENILTALGNLAGFTAGAGRFSGSSSYGAILNAIEMRSDMNILSTPSILTLDNTEASILVGQEVPFITGSTASENFENPFQTIQRREVGIRLQIRPQINDGNTVRLDILQEVSSIEDATRASDIITNKREISTTVLADDGDTIVLGGLITEEEREQIRRVPILSQIPLLGKLFTSTSGVREKRNLMIFIQPRILYSRDDAASLSSDKYRMIRAEQILRGSSLLLEEPSPIAVRIDAIESLGPRGQVVTDNEQSN